MGIGQLGGNGLDACVLSAQRCPVCRPAGNRGGRSPAFERCPLEVQAEQLVRAEKYW